MWVRGLKHQNNQRVGWSVTSHPMWVRGLKLMHPFNTLQLCHVAPYVGAWIETFACAVAGLQNIVAPYVGAWIETRAGIAGKGVGVSHPMWVRGLKLLQTAQTAAACPVAPYVGAWIETPVGACNYLPRHVAPYVGAWIETYCALDANQIKSVAPYVGAWIETDTFLINSYHDMSHPMWVRGLKPLSRAAPPSAACRTLCGCVD